MKRQNELIDDEEFVNHSPDYTYSHGPNLGITIRVFAGLASPIFFVLLINSLIQEAYIGTFVALIFLIPILWVLTGRSGVQICQRTKYFKEYSTFLGIKYGKWKSSRGLTDIAILTIRKNQNVRSGFGSNTMKVENIETGVYFLVPSHRKRVLIKICQNKREADLVSKELAEKLQKTLKIFSPQVSETTRNRRR